MNKNKGLNYYVKIFFFSVLALAIYIAYLSIKAGSIDYTLIYSLILVPFMFTIMLFLFDKVFDLIFPSKSKKSDTQFKTYLKTVGESITEQCDFSIEGYRRLRGNVGFQKSLEQVYRILTNGETPELSFSFLAKKFKKNTNEYIALMVVIEEAKKMMENSGKDYQK